LFVAANSVRVDIEGGGIGHIASRVVRNNRDVIAYLLIIWKTCLRVERIARRNIRRPRYATVGAVRIE
jgi:hypothetical protein